ncbi:MAG: molybdopterin-binding oxidoreductase [Acidobacteria bacterium]|nr:molybdopterin-binding oxidoreductase [Acidobacteriota bacterium]
MNNNRRAFLKFGVAGAAVLAGLNQLLKISPHEFNEKLTRRVIGTGRLGPEFARNRAVMPKANGLVGLDEEIELKDWMLKIDAPGASQRIMTIDEVKSLPRVEMTTELMCVKGWSEVVHWSGTPLRHIAPPSAPEYVGLTTPDESYFVGLDRESALHPQTLLAWKMNGAPLTSEHGAPLQLVIPVKYGIKNIKRIGSIRFTAERPTDYWAERGYDWFAGL